MQFDSWQIVPSPPASLAGPDSLRTFEATRIAGVVPGTVAAALQNNGVAVIESTRDLDSEDWWYLTTFSATDADIECQAFLCFEGLATEAEVWLNGESILQSDNMFRRFRVDVVGRLKPQNELCIVFRSLSRRLQARRPRPRWKTNLVSQQQLRWHRASLLGRIPGWSPPTPAIGPWRDVRLECSPILLTSSSLQASLEGDDGIVQFSATLHVQASITRAILNVGEQQCQVAISIDQNVVKLTAEVHVLNALLWWPHTHGPQALSACSLQVFSPSGDVEFDLVKIGFRRVAKLPDEQFGFQINGLDVYCRGACWTIADIVSFAESEATLRRDLTLARDAGINMLRVGGTMTYESDTFYRLCDEFGIMVWQDFPFANMDYPLEDEAFRANAEAEVRDQLTRLSRHPSLVVYCGNSEIEQQIAMLGLPRETWELHWFNERLPELCSEFHPGTVYVRSSPYGGDLPFHNRIGVSHYYGIGAYQRLPHELRKADVKFTSECLGFANIPEAETVAVVMGEFAPATHNPRWKRSVPRDTGPGWDFEDVRDFYLKHLFQVDPVELRSFDVPRYLQLSRVASGEMMVETFSEWRSPLSKNRGGLVWFYKDLRPGAGWGIIDSLGLPKAAYYLLKRVWKPIQLLITDEGLEGLQIHLVNESPESINGYVELKLLKEDQVVVASGEMPIKVSESSKTSIGSDLLLGRFCDVTYAYRFGPPGHDVAIATYFDERHRVIDETYFFVSGRRLKSMHASAILELSCEVDDSGMYSLSMKSDRLLQYVSLQAKGYLPEDNYFHLSPDRSKCVRFRANGNPNAAFKVTVEAMNLRRFETLKPGQRIENESELVGEMRDEGNILVQSRPLAALARKAFYLPVRGESLFAWYRESPEGTDHRHGILICPPTGYKQVHAHRSLRVLAERLAGEHFPVLSIDPHGTGDSPGSIQDSDRIETWLRNIEDSIAWLKEKAGCRHVTVIGLRFGATLAAMVAERQHVDDLILWAPISSGRQYARELRVLSSTTLGRDTPPPKEGDDIEPAGFVVTADTLGQITKLDLLTKTIRAERALILARDDFPDGDRLLNHLRTCITKVEQIQVAGFAEMVALPHYCKVPYAAIDTIVNRMVDVRGNEPAEASRKPTVEFVEQIKLQSMAGDSDKPVEIVERPIHLSEHPDLFGILVEPTKRPAQDRPLVLFLNGGASYRVGPNRLYVQTSRALAAAGFRCVRFDLCGLGDSLTPDPADENISYPDTFLRDVEIAIQYLRTSLGIEKVILLGLCAGAYHSYRSAARLADPALVESVVINPLTFHWKKGMTYEASTLMELKDLQYYLQMAFRPSKWLRLLSGKTDIGLKGAFDMLMSHRRALKKAEQPKSKAVSAPSANAGVALSDLTPDAGDNIPAELAKIAKAHRKISFFFSRSDQGRHILLYAAKKSVDKMKRSGNLTLNIIENADHTFSANATRLDLISQITKHLLKRYGS